MSVDLPSQAEEVFEKSLVATLTVINRHGAPVTHPVLPLYKRGEPTVYLTSSLLFSKKLEHIKANPRVSLCFSHQEALKVDQYRVVLLKGQAEVHEEDVHHGWKKLLPLWRKKEPYIDEFVAQRYALPLFWERAIIEVEPTKLYIWPEGILDESPDVYELNDR